MYGLLSQDVQLRAELLGVSTQANKIRKHPLERQVLFQRF